MVDSASDLEEIVELMRLTSYGADRRAIVDVLVPQSSNKVVDELVSQNLERDRRGPHRGCAGRNDLARPRRLSAKQADSASHHGADSRFLKN